MQLDAVVEQDNPAQLVLDTRGLTIHAVEQHVEGDGGKHAKLAHAFGQTNPVGATDEPFSRHGSNNVTQ